MNRAFFFDRDNCLIRDPDGYIHDPDLLEINPGVPELLCYLREAGYRIIIATNQAGIAYGYFTIEQYEEFNQQMLRQLDTLSGVQGLVDGVYYCPHYPDPVKARLKALARGKQMDSSKIIDCECRKPRTGMLLRAQEDHDIDLERSYLVGDKASDIECGQRAGCTTILYIYDHSRQPRLHKEPDFRVDHMDQIKEIVSRRVS